MVHMRAALIFPTSDTKGFDLRWTECINHVIGAILSPNDFAAHCEYQDGPWEKVKLFLLMTIFFLGKLRFTSTVKLYSHWIGSLVRMILVASSLDRLNAQSNFPYFLVIRSTHFYTTSWSMNFLAIPTLVPGKTHNATDKNTENSHECWRRRSKDIEDLHKFHYSWGTDHSKPIFCSIGVKRELQPLLSSSRKPFMFRSWNWKRNERTNVTFSARKKAKAMKSETMEHKVTNFGCSKHEDHHNNHYFQILTLCTQISLHYWYGHLCSHPALTNFFFIGIKKLTK